MRGTVRSSRLEPLPFVSVQVKEFRLGTLTKEDGSYELKLEPGRYELVYSMVGYRSQVVALVVGKTDYRQDIILEMDESSSMEGVVIRGRSRDRAEEIIRQAIRKREEHLAAGGPYSCRVYIKAVQEDSTLPSRKGRAKVSDSADAGEAYLHRMAMAEVVIRLDRGSERQVKEEREAVMKRGKADQLFFLSTTEADFTIYHALIKVPSISTAPLVSPISPGAPVAYRFKTLRIETVNGRKQYVIGFRPRQVSNATLEGEITIADSSWAVLHTRYRLPKYHLAEYDGFEVEQTYGWEGTVPVLERQLFTYTSKALRSRMSGQTLVRYSDYELQKRFPPGHFGLEWSTTGAEAYKKDSLFWQEVRPEPLSDRELRFVRYKDSMFRATHSKAYLDSLDRVINRFTWKKLLLTGQTLSDHEKQRTWYFPPLPALYQPFQLGGGRLQPGATYSKQFANRKTLWVDAGLSYGLRNRDLNGNLTVNRMYNPFNRGFYSVRLERDFEYIFEGDAWINMLKRSNIYLNNGIGAGHGLELANGLFLNSDVDLAFRQSVSGYRTNPKLDSLLGDVLDNNQAIPFSAYNAFYGKLRLSYTPGQRYLREPLEKVILGSSWPTFYVQWRKGIPGPFNSKVDFDYLELGLQQTIQLGTYGVSQYTIKSGSFLNKRDLRLVDYQFQRRGDPFLFMNPNEAFQSLDSTFPVFRRFYQGHYVHEFNGALLNKIPLLKKLGLREMGGAGFLFAQERHLRYAELFAGVERVFKWPFLPGAKFKLGFYAVGSAANQFRNPVQFKFGITSWDRKRNKWY